MIEESWTPHETNTHQDHVIAHVVGATVLGYFAADETAFVLLDIGFIWIVYLDGEMGLVPQSMAIAEFEGNDDIRAALRRDLERLEKDDVESDALECFKKAPNGCLIEAVDFAIRGDSRRLLIKGEDAAIKIETSLTAGTISFS